MEEEESEEVRCERLLRESRARREAIAAKHRASSGSGGGGGGGIGGGDVGGAAQAAAAAPPPPLPPPPPPPPPGTAPVASMFDLDADLEALVGGGARVAAAMQGGGGARATQQEAADAEGYFRPRIGELLGGRYHVLGVKGRGVFSCVLHCRDLQATPSGGGGAPAPALAPAPAAPSGGAEGVAPMDAGFEAAVAEVVAGGGAISVAAAPVSVGSSGALVARHAALATGSEAFVAIKVLRAQEVLRAAGEREADVLKSLATADPRGRYHTVRLLHVFEHAGHLCLAFEALAANLKEVAEKFGKGVGLPLAAVRVYGAQLLLALGLLRRLGLVHGDLKPHNILADATYGTVKLADFGSSFREDAPEAEPAPYVGSRFYRAPEAILGARHTAALDMWAAGCVLFELYTGEPLFAGRSNNDMLFRVQALFGRFPHKMLRKHLAHAGATGAEAHFDDALRFRRAVADPVTREPGVKLCDFTAPSESLAAKLAAARAGDSRHAVAAFQALLEGMLAPDPARRITPADALAHPFIKSPLKKAD